ncbi:hypothetical protein K457DRAFT_128418 [Linnemannia elongata AG-77]|uniref:Uncharacterized protein n=1 Tax=Linnemannia elongata AG-77 TaxID=1314771 RepID=A0A197JM15_9FUNG|nr:hypothetical protein K457DRAFT_128418 [Linnemannia elongata AG-77]
MFNFTSAQTLLVIAAGGHLVLQLEQTGMRRDEYVQSYCVPYVIATQQLLTPARRPLNAQLFMAIFSVVGGVVQFHSGRDDHDCLLAIVDPDYEPKTRGRKTDNDGEYVAARAEGIRSRQGLTSEIKHG